jgi:NNP family nitrate/nitrite transporter-like MFS transporter
MSNISTFFPKRLQGTALGLNAGLGNFGVTTMQIVIPLVMTVGLFGAFGGEPMTLMKDSGWIFGKIAAGTPTWIQNAGFAWVLSLVPLSLAVLVRHEQPEDGVAGCRAPDRRVRQDHLALHAGLPAVDRIGLYLYLPAPTGLGLISMWVAMPLDIVQRAADHEAGRLRPDEGERRQAVRDLPDKHTWSLTALYIVTFGSFIGFSMALPLSITVIFGISHVPDANGVMQHTLKNPNAPSAFTYAWIGPFVGARCARWAAGSRTRWAARSSRRSSRR